MTTGGNGTEDAAVKGKASPPYISFEVFRNFLEWLRADQIPLQFDRSFLGNRYSGATSFHLMAGLRFLGLLESDRPTVELHRLVEATDEDRKLELKAMLKHSYTAVDFESLGRATPKMLSSWLSAYHLEGSTARKAESFFINACKEAGISLPNAISKKARNRPVNVRTNNRKKVKTDSPPARLEEQLPLRPLGDSSQPTQVNQTIVSLESGGTVTLVLSVDLFKLSKKDLDFVLGLRDLVQSYGADSNVPNKGDNAASGP